MGVLLELGRPVLGTRFRDVERVVRRFAAAGLTVRQDNPVAGLVADPVSGALRPEILNEKVLSVLVEFVLPRARVAELPGIIVNMQRAAEVFTRLAAQSPRADATPSRG